MPKLNANTIVKRAAELQVSRKGRRELDAADFMEALSCLSLAIEEAADQQSEVAGAWPVADVVYFIRTAAKRARKRRELRTIKPAPRHGRVTPEQSAKAARVVREGRG